MFGYLDDLKVLLKVSVMFIALSGCQSSSIEINENTYMDDEIVEYVDRFEQQGQLYMYAGFKVGHARISIVSDAEVKKVSKNKKAVGVCRRYYREILISREYWERSNDMSREMLVFHELGHCILLRDHRDDNDGWGHPNSLMRWKMFDSWIYEANREYYIEELFLGYFAQPKEN